MSPKEHPTKATVTVVPMRPELYFEELETVLQRQLDRRDRKLGPWYKFLALCLGIITVILTIEFAAKVYTVYQVGRGVSEMQREMKKVFRE